MFWAGPSSAEGQCQEGTLCNEVQGTSGQCQKASTEEEDRAVGYQAFGSTLQSLYILLNAKKNY